MNWRDRAEMENGPNPLQPTVGQELYRLRECRLLCDTILRCDDGTSFPVHLTILSACSPYFLALALHSQEKSDFQICGVRSEMLSLLIEFAYLRRIEVTDTNVHELLMVADYLAFLDVLQQCCDHLTTSLNTKNCLGTMLFARRVFCYKLEADSRRYVLRYFVCVSTQSDEFIHLPLDELNSIIMEDELNVKSEEVVWEAVLRWVNYDSEHRWRHTVKLMASIRLGLLDTEFFLNNVKDHSYVTSNEGSRPIIIETLQFLFDMEKIAERDGEIATPEIAIPRIPHEVLFAIGGWSNGSATAFIETYDCRADRWIKMEEVDPARPRAYHGTAVLGNCIYVIGGFDGTDYFNSCRCFDAVTKTWREAAPMNAKRGYVSVAVLGETIYAMGGYDGHHRQNTAERFNHRSNQWSLFAPMNAQRSDASAAALDNKIYITGGFTGREYLNTVEVYDPESNVWTTLAPMQSRRSAVSCIAYHNKMYVFGGFNGTSIMCSGEVYDPVANSWSPVCDMYNPRSNFAIQLIDDMIFAIGGRNEATSIHHVECYDDKTNQWYLATDMNMQRTGLSACVIMGLPNVYDYIHKNRKRLMEEKRQKIQHRMALPDLGQVHQNEDNNDMVEQLGLVENQGANEAPPPPPPPPPPLPPMPQHGMEQED